MQDAERKVQDAEQKVEESAMKTRMLAESYVSKPSFLTIHTQYTDSVVSVMLEMCNHIWYSRANL